MKKQKKLISKPKTKKISVGKVIYEIVVTMILVAAAALVLTTFDLPGQYKLLAVLSGSMEPAIHVGSVVVVKPVSQYQVGDVVTAVEPANPRVSLTHRITEVKDRDGNISYVTKGDANKSADTEERPSSNVVGKVLFSIPYLGFITSFAKTQLGFIVMIIIPSVIIVYSELITIKNEAIKLLQERKKRKLTEFEKAEVIIGEEEIEVEHLSKRMWKRMKRIIPLLFISLLLTQNIGVTGAYLSDTETTTSTMAAGDWRPASKLDFYWQRAGQKLAFKVYGTEIHLFDTLRYEITYPTSHGGQVIIGNRTINDANELSVENLVTGICTTGGTCVFDEINGQIKLKVILDGVVDRTLEATLNP